MNDKKFLFYYQNCRGIMSKLSDIRLNIMSCNYDVIVLVETWLNPGINDMELVDDRYTVFRRDRDLSQTAKLDGGGVFVAVLKTLCASGLQEWENTSGAEDVFVSIPLKQHNFILNAVGVTKGGV